MPDNGCIYLFLVTNFFYNGGRDEYYLRAKDGPVPNLDDTSLKCRDIWENSYFGRLGPIRFMGEQSGRSGL